MSQPHPIKIFSGSSHPILAAAIAKELKIRVEPMMLTRFACNEIYARPEETIRGADVFLKKSWSMSHCLFERPI